MSHIEVLGVPIQAAGARETLARIATGATAERVRVAYVNAHTLNLACEQPRLREALRGFDFVLNDGVGVSIAARLQGRCFPANLQGSDFNLRLLELAAARGWPVFLLGARPGVAERAAARLRRRLPALRIAGARHGFHDDPGEDARIVAASGAQALFVALGNPRQELWLQERFDELPSVRLGVGVGAFLDFQAQAVSRAPGWMNTCGVEWVYRLAREPRRLAGRYLLGNPRFLLRVARERLALPAAGQAG